MRGKVPLSSWSYTAYGSRWVAAQMEMGTVRRRRQQPRPGGVPVIKKALQPIVVAVAHGPVASASSCPAPAHQSLLPLSPQYLEPRLSPSLFGTVPPPSISNAMAYSASAIHSFIHSFIYCRLAKHLWCLTDPREAQPHPSLPR